MEEKKATVMDKIHPDLLIPPHIVDNLFHLITGEKQPAPSTLEQMAAHLIECSYCRTMLLILLSAEQKYERSNESDGTSIHDFLIQIAEIHLAAEALDYEQIGAYAEAIVASGRETADEQFLILAKHITKCPICQSILEDMLASLQETEEPG